MGAQITEIATLFIGVALIALLVNRSQGTAQVIGAATSGFNQALRTVTLQDSGGMMGGAGFYR